MANRRPIYIASGTDTVIASADGVDAGVQVATKAPNSNPSIAFDGKDSAGSSVFVVRVTASADENVLIGDVAGQNLNAGVGVQNVVIGAGAGGALTDGVRNFLMGQGSGAALTTGSNNFLAGVDAGATLTVGANNFLLGRGSGDSLPVGARFNTAFGNFTLTNSDGVNTMDENLAMGYSAGRSLTEGVGNTFLGHQAGFNASQKVDPSNSTAIGANTFTTADNQVVIGDASVVETIVRGDTAFRIRNGTNAQTFEVYNTYTSSTNFERGNVEWVSNELRIGTEKGSGGGTARAMALQTDGTTRLTIGASGGFTVADAQNFAFNTSTGSKIGTATNQKIGFWNATPIVQPSGASQGALTDNSGGSVDGTIVAMTAGETATNRANKLNNNFADVSSRINAIRTALVNAGLMKGSA